MKKQVIEINGIYHDISNAYVAIGNEIVGTNTLQDHPDCTKYDYLKLLLTKLQDTGILSKKTEAIINYNDAFNNYNDALNQLQTYTEPEKETNAIRR